MSKWFDEWFNEDYLALYPYRNEKEAEQQVEAVISLLHLQGNEKILDLGCGAGRHMLAFLKRGYSITGVDLSDTLLNIAKEKMEAPLLKRDMRNLGDVGPFDCIVSLFTTFGYFEDPKDDLQVLHEVVRCLKPGGQFFLDTLHPDQEIQPISYIESQQITITRKREGDVIVKTITYPDKSYQERVRLYTRSAMEELFQKAGLRVTVVYNDFDGNPWRENGERQIFVGKR